MNNQFLSKVFGWFGIGLLVTFFVAYLTSMSIDALSFIFSGSTYFIIVILEFVVAIWLSARIHTMSSGLAKGLYLAYSALTGLTFSSLFIVYELTSIIWIFLDIVICVVVLAIFVTYVAYDVQKIVTRYDSSNEAMAIYGAFDLYLDFINIFLRLIQLFGKERD